MIYFRGKLGYTKSYREEGGKERCKSTKSKSKGIRRG